jgi:isochorismate hydrolase
LELKRHLDLIDRKKVGLLIIDIQDRVNQAMQDPENIINNSLKLIETFKLLNCPIWLTEQYPSGLGPTNARIVAALPEQVLRREKIRFSCTGDFSLINEIRQTGIEQLVVIGVESHVCVFQSAMDLLANGFRIFIPADAVSSRRKLDWDTGLQRARTAGIVVTTTEMVIFEMLEAAGSPEFKAISKLVK